MFVQLGVGVVFREIDAKKPVPAFKELQPQTVHGKLHKWLHSTQNVMSAKPVVYPKFRKGEGLLS